MFKKFLVLILMLFGFLSATSAQAVTCTQNSDCDSQQCVEGECLVELAPLTTAPNSGGSAATAVTSLPDPLKGVTVAGLIGRIIKGAMGILGAVALFVMVVGGFTWLTSAGNDEKIKSGTQAILWAVIGIAIALSSYVFVNTWLGALTAPK